MHEALLPNHFYYVGQALNPVLEAPVEQGFVRRLPLSWAGTGRHADEGLWVADLSGQLPPTDEWQFRIDLGASVYEHPEFDAFYTTGLRTLWVQDRQIYGYRPAPIVSPARVVKIEHFIGSLSPRPLYIYLPRGYDEHIDLRYPVLYMHDGQNCFEAFVEDSFAGSWQADLAANVLIRQGLMRECIIVGVSNGAEWRILEYLPPYARHMPPPHRPFDLTRHGPRAHEPVPRPLRPVPGRANRTFSYYRDDVAPYLARNYRVLSGRDNTATCGSSLGGLFTVYIAWEHPDFARHHAAISTAFWPTRNRQGQLEAIERLRVGPRRDIRLWLDSGTRSSPDRGDDGRRETLYARRALLEAGYADGPDFQYYLAEGATHSEGSWAARLPMVLQFLFPVGPD